MRTALIRQLDNVQRASVDRTFLASFGRFWADRKDNELLIEPDDVAGGLWWRPRPRRCRRRRDRCW